MMSVGKVLGCVALIFVLQMLSSIVQLSTVQNVSYASVNDDDFRYPLECDENDLVQYLVDKGIMKNYAKGKGPVEKEGNIKIAISYHVGIMNNWEAIVRDQMKTLKKCGLGQVADQLMLSYANGDPNQLQKVLEEYDFPMVQDFDRIPTVEGKSAPWEGGAMNNIYDYCKKQGNPESTVVFYFHNKAASRWTEDWKDKMGEIKSYAYSMYWRKYMEYFLLERPQLCLDQILFQGAKTCGILWKNSDPKIQHYSGNFWATTCDYVVETRKPIPDEFPTQWKRNMAAEFWIGSDDGTNPHPDHWHACLSDTKISPYNVLIAPEAYRLPRNEYSHLIGTKAVPKFIFSSDQN